MVDYNPGEKGALMEKITGESLAAALEKLRQLRRKEILSEEEFAVRKQEILFSLADGVLAEGPEDFLAPLVPLLEDGTLSQEEILVLKEFSLTARRTPPSTTPPPATGNTQSGNELRAELPGMRCPSCGKDISPAATSCKHCGSDLAGVPVSGRLPTRNKPSEALGITMLLVPATGAMLLWFWVGGMALIENPASKLALVGCLVVLISAGMAAVEANRLRMGTSGDLRGGVSPVKWFLVVAFLWVVGFPAYLYSRGRHGARNLVAGGLALAIIFSGTLGIVSWRIDEAKKALRDKLVAIAEASAAVEASTGTPAEAPRETPLWKTERTQSPLDQSPTVVLSHESEDTVSGGSGKAQYPILVLQCAKGKTQAYVNARMQLTSTVRTWSDDYSWGSSTTTPVRWRFDDEKPGAGRWTPSTDYVAAYVPQPLDFIKRMAKHEKLIVELDIFRGGTQMVTFNVSGLVDVLPELRAACKW